MLTRILLKLSVTILITFILTVLSIMVVYADGPVTIETADPNINDGDGLCSLIEAMVNINDDAQTYTDCPTIGIWGEIPNTIILQANTTYTLTTVNNSTWGENGLPVIMRDVIINGNGATIARSTNSGVPDFRIFFVTVPQGNLSVNDLIIRNGRATGSPGAAQEGGGLYNIDTVTLNNCSIINNVSATSGSGIYNQGILEINYSTIENNKSTGSGTGGGIYNEGSVIINNGMIADNGNTGLVFGGGIYNVNSGTAVISGSIITDNTAHVGGGIYNHQGTTTITNTSITNNVTYSDGGGIFNGSTMIINRGIITKNISGSGGGNYGNGGGINNSDTITITNSIISENRAESGTYNNGVGGSIYNSGTTVISNSTLNRNTGYDAGGIYNNGILMLSTAMLSGNIATDKGGGIFYNGGTLVVTNTTVVSNAASLGGGVSAQNGNSRLVNVLLARNSAESNGDALYLASNGIADIIHTTIASPTLAINEAIYINNGVVNITNTIVTSHTIGLSQAGTGVVYEDYNLFYSTTPISGTNINSGGNSQYNSGIPTFSNPYGDDYTLRFGSTAIDAGIDLGIQFDIEGDVRPYNSGIPDIGYDEFYPSDPEIVVLNETVSITDNMSIMVGFSTAVVGSPVTKTFTVSNTGETNLILTEPITVPNGFSVASSFSDTILSGGAQTTFTIQLDASGGGVFSGTLAFANNDVDENPFNFVISGTVKTLPEIQVFEGTTDIFDNSGNVEFGATVVGNPLTKTFTISNTGETQLVLTEPITIPNGFSIFSSFSDTTLDNSQQTTFTIQLDAISTGVYSGEVAFENNDADESPFNFIISGTVNTADKSVYLPIILKQSF